MLQSFEFEEITTHYKLIRSNKYEVVPSYFEFVLKKPIRVVVGHEIKYLVMGKKIKLTSSDMDLLDKLNIVYQRVSVPIYFQSSSIFCNVDIECHFIMTDDRVTGDFKYEVSNYKLIIN